MNNLTPFITSFGLSEAEFASACAKMSELKITPHKMIHDSSFVEFYIPTANGNKDIRKELSDIIATVSRLAGAAGFPKPEPKEFGDETIEEFLSVRRDFIREALSKK